LPLVPIFIAFAVGAVVSGSVVSNWENIVYSLKGKKIAVLGARRVGKTTLLKYMEKGILIERYNQTVNKEDIQRTRIKLGDLDILIKKTEDVSSSEIAYFYWKKLFEEADLVLYIVRTDRLLDKDSGTEKRTENDLKQIQNWIKELGATERKQFFIVGNHWNSDPRFKNLTRDTIGDYQNEFTSLPIVKKITQLAGGAAKVKVALGSLANEQDADNLIKEIFRQVEK
jgi:energy-coupling factor transporter ATP-binding protein EcfA2